jgi:hypothetical protein
MQIERDMDFQEFLGWSARAIASAPHVIRLSETRIARALASRRYVPADPDEVPTVHRCDLVRLWCNVRGISVDAGQTALACEGVRHALQIVFRLLAARGTTVAIPSDVYPVYWKIASQARVQTFAFSTFPHFDIDRVLSGADEAGADVVLLPQPLKLHGRAWTEDEAVIAEQWLHSGPKRRLVLDGVYGLGLPLPSVTKRLIATDQVLFLDSLSKGWLHEQIFGVAIVPERDFASYAMQFRSLVASKSNLYLAHELLTRSPQAPRALVEELNRRRNRLLQHGLPGHIRTLSAESGYLIAVEASADELLTRHSLLTIPATVFGSHLRNWSIASALPEVGT